MPDQQHHTIRVTVQACPDHPNNEPTMPAARCGRCGRQLTVTTTVLDDEEQDR